MSTMHSNTVLIVEDEPSIAETTRYLLEAAGYEVETADTGARALAMLHERRPRLVLLDIELPDLSGIEICAAIRNEPELRSTKVVFLTTHDANDITSAAPNLVVDGHLRKPIDIDVLLATVAGFMTGAGGCEASPPLST